MGETVVFLEGTSGRICWGEKPYDIGRYEEQLNFAANGCFWPNPAI